MLVFFSYYCSFFYLFAKLLCEMYCIPKNLNSLPVESITLFFVNSFGSFGNASDCFNWHSKQKPVKKDSLAPGFFSFQFCGFVDSCSSTRGLNQIWNFGNPGIFWWHARTLVTYYVRIVPMSSQHLMLYKTQSLTCSTCLKSAIILTREMIAHVTLWLRTCSLVNEFNAKLAKHELWSSWYHSSIVENAQTFPFPFLLCPSEHAYLVVHPSTLVHTIPKFLITSATITQK